MLMWAKSWNLKAAFCAIGLCVVAFAPNANADIALADAPLYSTVSVPGNLALTLSVEWPTANTPAYKSSSNAYSVSNTYLGYFDSAKCYLYNYNSTTPAQSYFSPYSLASSHACNSTNPPLWSGNYLNWASMQSLDVFRWALSGGTRVVDTATQTILEKTYNSGQASSSVYPDTKISGSTLVKGATPFTWSEVDTSAQNYVKNTNYGTVMWVSGSANSNMSSATGTDYVGATTADSSKIYRVYIRVQVCSTSVSLESNCVQYGSNYKPEGVMQKYAMKLRYADFGYLNDSNVLRDGGVLRAKMKYIGPQQPVPGSANITNTAAEWSATDGTQYSNPDSSDASNTSTAASSQGGYSVTVSNSGVLNYLNKFGKITPGDYKSYDPVSELYYAAIRYFKNQGNVSTYSNLSGSGSQSSLSKWIDGFPVIQTWTDPILYSCQKNFILGIGDVNSHRDANLPGSTLHASGQEPAVPSDVTTDTATNVTTSTNMVGQLEGLGNIGAGYVPWASGRYDTYFIAGLAYDSHVKDIRSDLTGTQTINTYWMDVYETGYQSKNQYWLATKYGGFDVPSGFSSYSSSNGTSTIPLTAWHTTSDTVGSDYRPDNYFPANNPSAMVTGLNSAFSKIVSEASSANSTTFNPPEDNSDPSSTYGATYDSSNWTGSLYKGKVTYTSGTASYASTSWNLRDQVTATAASARRIVTCCTTSGAALPFETSNLSGSLSSRTYYASFANVPGISSSSQSAVNYVAYLRGDRSQELQNGGVYRNRKYLLGDIVNSNVVPMTPPGLNLSDVYNPGYSAFVSSYSARKTVVFAGANDGMLHAADGSTGAELFAYIPSFVYGNSSTASTTGLASLGNPSYTHHYFVDGKIYTHDVDFFLTPSPVATTNDWHTLLVGGLGKGGNGYYAIDVTDPTSWGSESAVAGKVLWEFTDSTMGYTYGMPLVVKTEKYGWVVILTSGYNNSDGKGYFYIVNPRTGSLLEKIVTPEGSTSSPINLAYAQTYIDNDYNGRSDSIYAGDMQGNIWRVDLTGSPTAYPAPVKIAKLTNAAGVAQPVTTLSLVQTATSSGKTKRYVVVGTGRLLADTDETTSDLQSIYSITDGLRGYGGFNTSSSLPSGVSFPISRSNLANDSSMTGIGTQPDQTMGWYVDLGSSAGIAERIKINPKFALGLAIFSSNTPNGDVCSPGGSSNGYAFDLATGTLSLVGGITLTGEVVDFNVVYINGIAYVVFGKKDGSLEMKQLNPSSSTSYQRINWRVIQTGD